jgi:signal transduction histidine kinase
MERERARLARELHDGLGGTLAALALETERAVLAVGDAAAVEAVRRVKILADAALEDLRRATRLMQRAFDLHSAIASRLEHTARRLAEGAGGSAPPASCVDFRVVGRPRRLPSELQLSIFRAAQEMLTNVERHARATRARVALAYAGDAVRLGVRDDGVGLSSAASGEAAGHGLRNLRARTARFGGEVELRAPRGGGACVVATFRIPAEGSHVHRVFW